MSILTTTTKLSALSRVGASVGDTMDRLIWAAWRAFWVGLGASAVLIAESLLAAPPAQTTVDVAPSVEVPVHVAPTYARPGQS